VRSRSKDSRAEPEAGALVSYVTSLADNPSTMETFTNREGAVCSSPVGAAP
jgi:hypothetical protein